MFARLNKAAGADVGKLRTRARIQVVYFHQSNSTGVVHTAHNGGLVALLEICNDRRLACRSGSVAAVLNVADLIAGDNPTDYRILPVILVPKKRSVTFVHL